MEALYYLFFDDSSVLKPPAQDELIQWLYDYSGDFVLLDKVNPRVVTVPDVVGVSCVDVSTLGSHVKVGTPTFTPTHISFWIDTPTEINSASGNKILIADDASSNVVINSGGNYSGAFDDETLSIITGQIPSGDEGVNWIKDVIPIGVHFLEFDWDGTDWIIKVDGVAPTLFRFGTPRALPWDYILGCRGSAHDFNFNGSISNFHLSDGTNSLTFPLQESAGTKSYGELKTDGGLSSSVTAKSLDLFSDYSYEGFPNAYRNPTDGRIHLIYRAGSDHYLPARDGVIMEVISTDDGDTWGTPAVLFSDANLDIREASILALSNGDLLYTEMIYDKTLLLNRVRAKISSNNGVTWGTPIELTGTANNFGYSGNATELSNGDILVPVYIGTQVSYGYVRSNVSDATAWGSYEIIGSGSGINESQFIDFGAGEVRSYVRVNAASTIKVAVSTDYGVTWGSLFAPTMAASTLDGGSPSVINVDGVLLLSTRASSPTKIPQFFMSKDKGDTWGVVFYPYSPNTAWNTYSAFVLRNDGKVLDVTGLHYGDTNGDLGSTVITITAAGALVAGVEADLIGSVAWTTADGIPSHNLRYGYTPALASSGLTGPYINTGEVINNPTKLEYTFVGNSLSTNQVPVGIKSPGLPSTTFLNVAAVSCEFPISGDMRTAQILEPHTKYTVVIDYQSETIAVNGIEQPLISGVGTFGVDDEVTIGARYGAGAASLFFDGLIYDVRVYSGDLVFIATPLPHGQGMVNGLTGAIYPKQGLGNYTTIHDPALVNKTTGVATFDGVADNVRSELGISEKFAFPFTTYTFGTEYKGADERFFQSASGDAVYYYGIQIMYLNGNRMRVQFGDGTGGSTSTNTRYADVVIDPSVSHDIVVVARSITDWDVYINGVAQSITIVGSASTYNPSESADRVSIGSSKRGPVLYNPYEGSFSKAGVFEDDLDGVPLSNLLSGNTGGNDWEVDFTSVVGKPATVDGSTVITGAGGLDSFWSKRVADERGVRVDANGYNLIGVRGSVEGALIHNGCEVGFIVTDGKVVDLIEVTGTGTVADGYYYITGTYLGETEYSHVTEAYILTFNGTGWGIFGTEVWESQPSATRVPPKVWDNEGSSGSPAPTLKYGYQGSFWVNDDGTFKDVYFSDYVAHPSGLYNLFLKSGPDTVGTLGQCVLLEHGQYSLAHVFDDSALPKLNRYWSVCDGWATPVQQLLDTYYAIDKLGSYATDSQGDYFITIQ